MQTAIIGHNIEKAAELLQVGQVIGIPTETVYGLAGMCNKPKAIEHIYRIKRRPPENPLILHCASLAHARPWIGKLSQEMERLAAHFWPGPLTLLVQKNERLHPRITAGLPRVALRIPAHPVTGKLLAALPAPVVAPSANLSGHISSTCATHVAMQLGDQIPYILTGDIPMVGIESSILGFEHNQPVLYRAGAISAETLEAFLGCPLKQPATSTPQAPGGQRRHYAPCLPLHLGQIDELLARYGSKNIGLLRFSALHAALPANRQYVLSLSGDLQEAASKLFSALHELEKMKISCILAEPVPQVGIGVAINDRLYRAAQPPLRGRNA